MNRRTDEEVDALIDRAAGSIRATSLDPHEAEAAADRVRARLRATIDGAPLLGGCDAYRQLMPAALRGELPAARRTLIEQHTHECVTCRRAWNDLRAGRDPLAAHAPQGAVPVRRGWGFWAAAAAVLVLLGIGSYVGQRALVAQPARSASVLQADGLLFRIRSEQTEPVTIHQAVAYGEGVRTAKNGGAVLRLPDGTMVEMRERTELALAARGRDTDIRLARGAIIVQASHQGSGHLFVTTADCRVAVTGTVFTVDQGTKGARVSVLRGEVHVAHAGNDNVLHPGQQFASSTSMGQTPIATEVAWSRDRAQYDALLADLAGLERDIAQIPGPAPRRSTRLLDLAPADTVVFASLPNISGTVGEAHRLLSERLRSSAPLAAWWAERVGDEGERSLEQAIATIRRVGDQLGDEIAVAVTANADAKRPVGGVMLLANVKNAATFRSVVEDELARLPGNAHAALRFIDDPKTATVPAGADGHDTLDVWIHGDVLAIASSPALLAELAARIDGTSPFAATPFHARLASAYADGVVWLGAADVGRMLGTVAARSDADGERGGIDTLRRSGLLDARYLMVQGTGDGTNATFEATLDFNGPRHGVASWLAKPAPMGSLAFVSPDATMASAVVVKDPALLLDDIYEMLGEKAPEAKAKLEEATLQLGVDVKNDVLRTLGGEVTIALDGPMLPTPAWKLVVEVYDPARLQQAIETIVRQADARLATNPDAPRLESTKEEIGGRTYYSVGVKDALHVHYTYADGYLVMAPQRALVERSLENRQHGLVLTASAKFREMLPKDREANFSALFYRDTTSLLKTMGKVGVTPSEPGPGAPHGNGPLGALLAAAQPGLEYAYGDDDRITLAGSGGRVTGLELGMLLGLAEANGKQHHGQHAPAEPPAPGSGA